MGQQRTVFRDDTSKSRGRVPVSRKFYLAIVGVLCALVAVLAIAGVTYSMQLWGGKAIPDVVGFDAQEAEAALADAGFTTTRILTKSDVAEGTVVGTDPMAGSRADEGTQVKIEIATARTIPNVIGMNMEDARSALFSEGLGNITVSEVRSNETAGTVLSVNPNIGSNASQNTSILIEIAVSHRVPNIAGMSESDAFAALRAEGYEVEIEKVYAEDLSEGTAVETNPEADSELTADSTVVLKVAKHRESELLNLTRKWFSESKNVNIGGTNYEIGEVKDVKYKGDGTVEYSLTARPYESLSWLGIETRYGNLQTVKGSVTWDDRDEMSSSSPSLARV